MVKYKGRMFVLTGGTYIYIRLHGTTSRKTAIVSTNNSSKTVGVLKWYEKKIAGA